MKIKYQLFLGFLFFAIPFTSAFASTDISVKCPNGSVVGSTIDCEVFVTSDIEISAVSTKLSVSDNLEFVSFKTDSSWQGNGDNGDVSLYTYPNQIGEIKLGIATLKIKESNASRTGTIYVKEVTFYDADFSDISGGSVSKNIKILSNNYDLASLSLVGYNINPNFNKGVTEYQATVDSDIVVIEASPLDEFATISGVGRKELNSGENTFNITVTSEAGAKKIYKLIITRPKKQEENYFNREDIPNQALETTDNKELKPETEKNKDSKLKSLLITGYTLDFSSDKYFYDLEVASEVEKLEIKATSNSEKAKVTIQGNDHLSFGKNEITITVEAEDGSKSTYSVYVTKKGNVCLIKSILITNYDFTFGCNQYDYELEIGMEDSLNIEVIPNDQKTKVEIHHNDHLKDGDIITILASTDNTNYKYSIKIIKKELASSNIIHDKKFILIAVITILGLLYFIGRYLIRKKNFKNKENIS
ncbi:MAG: cadherin-like beta sandwich domain-containing protein [Erysipelotrichaceae bacterium]|nr:cadherin-like beta sandwich domain-containing protein [Erysipelotrichaceae bacterium]